jgi:hypothetical protein
LFFKINNLSGRIKNPSIQSLNSKNSLSSNKPQSNKVYSAKELKDEENDKNSISENKKIPDLNDDASSFQTFVSERIILIIPRDD